MKNPQIIVMVGNIGSGKTTLVNKLVKAGYIVVSRDAIRYMIGNGKYIFNPKIEGAVFRAEQDIIANFMNYSCNIVVDEVGVSKGMRKCYIELANTYGYDAIAIEMQRLGMKESVDRRMNDPHGQSDRALWEGVWKKFDKVYESPKEIEGFKKVIRLGVEEYNEGLEGFPKEHI